jgi:hypothetical protein
MEDTSTNHAMLRHMERNVKFLTHATLGSWTHAVEVLFSTELLHDSLG